jgi:hypothetical protein
MKGRESLTPAQFEAIDRHLSVACYELNEIAEHIELDSFTMEIELGAGDKVGVSFMRETKSNVKRTSASVSAEGRSATRRRAEPGLVISSH